MKQLTTVFSKKSLISFQYTFRKQDYDDNGKFTKLIWQKCYANVFKTIANEITNNAYSKIFSSSKSLWHKIINDEYVNLLNSFNSLSLNYKESKDKIYNEYTTKFRGNCAEILIEAMANNGCFSPDFIELDSYVPVDPDAERGNDTLVTAIDAKAKSSMNGNEIGIQIKNWQKDVNDSIVFDKACSTSWKWQQQFKENEFNQYIIGFSDSFMAKNYEKFGVKFLNAKYLDSKGLNKLPKFFNDIADQILNYK